MTWEYKIAPKVPLSTLMALGREGWEAFAVEGGYVYLKRPSTSVDSDRLHAHAWSHMPSGEQETPQ